MDLRELVIAKNVEPNTRGRDFIVADLHGCYSALGRAMEAANFDTSADRLFALGDLVDRGNECVECLELVTEPWFYSVLGNHEYMMMAALHEGVGSLEWHSWMQNGGFWFEQLHREQYDIIKTLLPNLADLPITITLELANDKRVGLCHAEPPGGDWEWFVEHPAPDTDLILKALWGREKIRSRLPVHIRGVDATFHGHTIVDQHTVVGNMHFVDTGAYLNQQVTLVELNNRLITQKTFAA